MAFEGEDARRWMLVDAPALQPGVDFITKSPNGPFIDTGLDVKFEQRGRMYLSVETIREMAQVAGLLEAKSAREKRLYDIETFQKGYEQGLREGKELLGKLDSVISNLSPDTGWLQPARVETAEPEPEDATVESGEPDGNSGDIQATPARSRGPRGKTGSTRSSGRPDDVPSTGDDDERYRI